MVLSDISKLTAAAGFTERTDPFGLFGEWLKEAEASEPNDPNAMALATVDEEGLPNVRMVLLKGFDERGFVFPARLLLRVFLPPLDDTRDPPDHGADEAEHAAARGARCQSDQVSHALSAPG